MGRSHFSLYNWVYHVHVLHFQLKRIYGPCKKTRDKHLQSMLSFAFPVQIPSILKSQLKSHFIQEICPDNTGLIYWSPPLNS